MIISSVTHLCPTLCDPMDCSTPGFPLHHQLLELAQTHVHLVHDTVGDAIKPSYPLSSPSPPPSIFPSLFLGVSFFFFFLTILIIFNVQFSGIKYIIAFKLCFKDDTTYFHSFSLSSNFKVKKYDFESQPRWCKSCY